MYWPVYDLWHNAKGMEMTFRVHTIKDWLVPSSFYQAGDWMRKKGFDYDYVSDNFLSEAKVSSGMIKLPGGSYKTLVVPTCNFMPEETLSIIINLISQGAKVVFVGSLPADVNGLNEIAARREKFENLKDLLSLDADPFEYASKKIDKGELFLGDLSQKMFEELDIRSESMVESGISFIRRQDEIGKIYFLSNLKPSDFSGWVVLATDARSGSIFDPITGNSGTAQMRNNNGETEFFLQLESGQSLILRTYLNREVSGQHYNFYQPTGNPVELRGPWSLELNDGVSQIDSDFVLDSLISWTKLDNAELTVYSGSGKYKLIFNLPDENAEDWCLDLGEVCESANVNINGRDAGIWWSIPFRSNVGKYLKKGENTIEIEVTNLSANRIADLDRRGVKWKIFENANVMGLFGKPFDASNWKPKDSGLIGPVTLTPLKVTGN